MLAREHWVRVPELTATPADLEELWLSRNPLSGQVPTKLGNLTGLMFLDLRDTLLSGPLPESLTRLSALTWLQLEGSGLCVPDASGFAAWVAAIRSFTGAVCAGSPTFLWVVTPPGPGPLDIVHAVADLDGDGRDDILAGEDRERNVGAPEERLAKTTLRVLVGEKDGSFTPAPELVDGTIDARPDCRRRRLQRGRAARPGGLRLRRLRVRREARIRQSAAAVPERPRRKAPAV